MPDRLSDAEKRIYGFVSSEAQDLYRRGVKDGPGWSNGLTRALHRAGEALGYDVIDVPRNLIEFRPRTRSSAVAVVCKVQNSTRVERILRDVADIVARRADLRVLAFDPTTRYTQERLDLVQNAARGRQGCRFLAIGLSVRPLGEIPYRAWTT